jgi:lysophospholipase L1-like esterase
MLRLSCAAVVLATVLVACGGDDPAPTTAEGRTSCKAVMHIGDSLTVGMMGTGMIPDPELRLDAQYRAVGVEDVRGDGKVGRTIHEVSNEQAPGVEVAQQARADGFAGCWVVELGTNDVGLLATQTTTVGPRQRIDEMMAVIGDEPAMWLTTVTQVDHGDYDSANMEAWNAILVDAAGSYPNMHIFDWASVADPDWFAEDDIHNSPTGCTEMARRVPSELARLLPEAVPVSAPE